MDTQIRAQTLNDNVRILGRIPRTHMRVCRLLSKGLVLGLIAETRDRLVKKSDRGNRFSPLAFAFHLVYRLCR